MFAARYRFLTDWHIANATTSEVADILEDVDSLAVWWPSVYLEVTNVAAGGEHGLGRVVDLHTKGWLPYHLYWRLSIIEVDYPNGSRIEANGDLSGRGLWKFVQRGQDVAVSYDWEVDAGKPLLRYGSPIFRPLFAANHRWAMRCGETSLQREILRRRAEREGRLFDAPPPPGPTFVRPLLKRRTS